MQQFLFTLYVAVFMIVSVLVAPALAVEGIVKAVHEIDLAFQIDGVIAKLFVKEGSRVAKGDALIQLDDALQRLEVSRREAIFNDRAELETNKKNLSMLKELLDSSRSLYNKLSAISRDELLGLEMQYQTQAGKIDMTEARKKQEQIELDIARELLRRYTLSAPVGGTITLIKHEVGEWSRSGEMLVTLVDTSSCYAEFHLEERSARNLKVDRQIPIKVRQGEALVSKTGKIVFIAPVADKASGLVRVKVEFENKNGKIVPGVLATMDGR